MSAFQHYDTILSRDWFANEDDIVELLEQMDYLTFQEVYLSRHKYSDRVRYHIDPSDYCRSEKAALKVVDLTDKDMERIREELREKNEKHFEAEWERYKKTLERPEDSVDHDADEVWQSLDILKHALESHLKSKQIKYVPPSMRGKNTVVDNKQKQLEEKIAELENEFKKRMEAVEREDTVWFEFKKNEFRQKMYQL